MESNKYSGIYLGIVIQNNDPEHRGRVKVFVPHISSNITKINTDEENKLFNFLDNETNPKISNIITDLKNVLPWAEYAGPIFGGNASGRYNAYLNKGSTSDANNFENGSLVEGFRPLQVYANDNAIPDAFNESGKNGNLFVNPLSFQYKPSNYSNLAKGFFSIPNVGAHLWIFFINGDTNFPVYFASSYSENDIKRIYSMSQKTDASFSSVDYPGKYENYSKADQIQKDSDNETFRSKHVFNSNKHSFEMIDTDNREILKMTHYNGSFKEFNNFSNIEFATANDQKMVLGDSFKTIKKNNSTFIGGIEDYIIKSDRFLKIGDQKTDPVYDYLEIQKEIHEYKRLFDLKRTRYNNESVIYAPNSVSVFQSQRGIFAVCPKCKGLPYIQGTWEMVPALVRFCIPAPAVPGIDVFLPGLQPLSEYIGQVGYYGGMRCDVCNKSPALYQYVENHLPGQSPSTENGFWEPEDAKIPNGKIDQLLQMYHPQLLALEEEMGEGGDDIESVARNKVLNIGLVVNNLKPYRIDARGKVRVDRVFVSLEKTYESSIAVPHVEHVEPVNLPGGDFTITAGNKFKLLVGANGINIKTFGPIEMYGSIVNLTGEQTNIITTNDLFLDGGEKLTLRGRHISINPFEHNPLLVEGQLHVSRNAIVKGGAYIEGELGVQHVTAPLEWQTTEPGGCITILAPIVGPYALVTIPDHTHYFKNLPLKLTLCKEETRDSMIQLGINGSNAINAYKPIQPLIGVSINGSSLSTYLTSLTSALGNVSSNKVFDPLSGVADILGNVQTFVGSLTGENDVLTIQDTIGAGLNTLYGTLEDSASNSINQILDSVRNSEYYI